ncbi:MAG: YifB family Mg chelatase-like AAA ATPase [Firmicutes bacterium]|nr:YifB family Mg chelatase-like AAA ATPase [Bacillota bacterium]MBQ6810413.1 YifB family Mg chelatase-like AAA ATPase [Bacillota bacterium]
MLAKVNSIALRGLEPHIVTVEADVSNGVFSFDIVGLPEAAVKESRERIKAALKNAGYVFPAKRIIVNLAPADLKKNGTSFDLPIAMALLLATDQISSAFVPSHSYFFGELSLDGSVAAVNGVLPMVSGICNEDPDAVLFLPAANGKEASLDGRGKVYPIESLRQLDAVLNGTQVLEPVVATEDDLLLDTDDVGSLIDMKDIKGQSMVKRGMEIAAAGGHNVLMMGVPGSGKTLLARSFPTILPPLTRKEALETTAVYSLAGELGDDFLIRRRPFRSPHHTSSAVSLTGGGVHPKPGEISLAYHGVLFLDEVVEFPKNVLQVLRQPLEDHKIHVSRASGTYTFPADFQLVAACNPCPCGFYGDPERECTCSESQISRYFNKIGGPLMDRMDIHMNVARVTFRELHDEIEEESSADIRKRVIAARKIQQERYAEQGLNCNAELNRRFLDQYCKLDKETEKTLEKIFDRLHLSARGHDRIIKVARTIADLNGEKDIHSEHLMEAVRYRSLDRI